MFRGMRNISSEVAVCRNSKKKGEDLVFLQVRRDGARKGPRLSRGLVCHFPTLQRDLFDSVEPPSDVEVTENPYVLALRGVEVGGKVYEVGGISERPPQVTNCKVICDLFGTLGGLRGYVEGLIAKGNSQFTFWAHPFGHCAI